MQNLSNLYRVWAEIDLDALLHNHRQMCKAAGSTTVMPVIKADAYGHGALAVAHALQQEAGVRQFAVVTQEEALILRQSGIQGLILMMGVATVGCLPALQKADISLCLPDLRTAKLYSATTAGQPLKIHLKLDTGMSRLGMREETAAEEILAISRLPGLIIKGAFTQLSSSDLPDEDDFTKDQYARFQRILHSVEGQGITVPLRHCANSAATMSLPTTHEQMVRNGLTLYGYQSREEDLGYDLQPILAWYSSIAQCKEVPKGGSIGYDRGYRALHNMLVATVPVGYADGLLRGLSGGGGHLLVQGQKAPIVGKICMDMCMLDVTGIAGVAPGDLVTILGQDGSECLTADDLAATLGTISYEVLCTLGKRVPRLYRQHGQLQNTPPYWSGYFAP